MPTDRSRRVALVVHPARPIDEAVAAVRRWAGSEGLEIVQICPPGSVARDVAPSGVAEPGDLVVALGGDGTVLSALREAATVGAPVLGAACGSLGVLTPITDQSLDDALARFHAGDWIPRRLPALAIHPVDGVDDWAVNDFVAVRKGAGQLVASVWVDDQLYVRIAGDGLVVATALGSSGYSMAAGGPVLVDDAALVCTPIAMHGGSAPPLVVPASSTVRVDLQPGFAGYDIEIDGHTDASPALSYELTLALDKVTLITFAGASGRLTRLRERRLVTDSPRVLARDDRDAAAGAHD
jgi:NAD+ kinase